MGSVMPLTLITGPANAAKAGAVLERLRAALPRDPVLVVPTTADATHYARELAGAGLVFGAEVTTFPCPDARPRPGRRDSNPAAGAARPRAGRPRRDRRRGAARAEGLGARARASPRRSGTCSRSCSARWRRPARFGAAVRAWREGARRPTPASSPRCTRPTTRRLEALEAVDADGLTHLALNAAREAWDGRPLFLYGFDELLPTQLDFVETLVRHTDTELTVAVTYEPGRAALAGSATTVELLKPLAREHVDAGAALASTTPRAPAAPCTTSSAGCSSRPVVASPPNGAVRLLEAGGERAEAELVGASVLELLRDGMAPEDIAVLVRGGPASELFAQVFDTYGIPVAHERRTPFAQTRLGAGLLAFARAALARRHRPGRRHVAAHAGQAPAAHAATGAARGRAAACRQAPPRRRRCSPLGDAPSAALDGSRVRVDAARRRSDAPTRTLGGLRDAPEVASSSGHGRPHRPRRPRSRRGQDSDQGGLGRARTAREAAAERAALASRSSQRAAAPRPRRSGRRRTCAGPTC